MTAMKYFSCRVSTVCSLLMASPTGQPVASDGDGARIGNCAPGDGGLGEWDGPGEVLQEPPGQGRVAGGVAVGVVGDGVHGLDAHVGQCGGADVAAADDRDHRYLAGSLGDDRREFAVA